MFWKKKEKKVESVIEHNPPPPREKKERPKNCCEWCGAKFTGAEGVCSHCGGPNERDYTVQVGDYVFRIPKKSIPIVKMESVDAVIPYKMSPTERVYKDVRLEE